jgi:hypothetical protein
MRHWDEAKEYYREKHRLMKRERRFALDLEHFDNKQDDEYPHVRVVTEALTRVLRFKVGQLLGVPDNIDARPAPRESGDLDAQSLAQQAQFAKWATEWEMTTPRKRFENIKRDMAWSGFAARMGAASIDFYPDLGPYGELLWRTRMGEEVMWTPGWKDPHDPTCPWLLDIERVLVSSVKGKQGWKHTEDVLADDGNMPLSSGDPGVVEGLTSVGEASNYHGDARTPGKFCTIIKCWYKNDTSYKTAEMDYEELPEDARHMACGCGYTGPSQGESDEQRMLDMLDPEPYPAKIERGCPTCGGDLTRIDAIMSEGPQRAWPQGRLVIIAPFSKVTLYDDAWPEAYKYCRSFPYWLWQSNVMPHTAIGPSETTFKWSLQILDDATMRMGYEQMARNRDITLMPRIGLEDAQGAPFNFLDNDGFAFYTNDAPLGANSVQHFQGSGLNAAWSTFRNDVRATFRADEGTADLSVQGPKQTKDIPVGTIERMVESGNVPVDDQIRSWQNELGMAMSLQLDMIRATYTPARAIRYRGKSGLDDFMLLAGSEVPDADIVLSAMPNLERVSVEKMQALMQWAQLPPTLRRIGAREMNIAPGDVQEVEAEEAQMRALMQQQAQAAPMSPAGGNPPPKSQAMYG